jgi:hypothetical protein
MSTNTTDPTDGLPTEGPGETVYDQYRFVTATEDGGIIYHVDEPDQWIECGPILALDEWR